MPVAEIVTNVKSNLERLFNLNPSVSLFLLNDESVWAELVVKALVKFLKVSSQKAQEHMIEAHTYGKSLIFTGDKNEAVEIKKNLEKCSLTIELLDN